MTTDEIPLPDRIAERGGEEILRVIVDDDGSLLVCRVASLPDPRDWGIVLVDVARHVTRAISRHCELVDDGGERRPITQEEALIELRKAFDEEWSNGTEEVRQLDDA